MIEIQLTNHTLNETKCKNCYSYDTDLCLCGGRIHCEFEDEVYDETNGEIYLFFKYKCDKCGSTNRP